ncbi:hypothetical protein M8J75_009375 [Diaphorina citri]|nr:hypothetical protein M8J75_009375 [Diaphorina citri]
MIIRHLKSKGPIFLVVMLTWTLVKAYHPPQGPVSSLKKTGAKLCVGGMIAMGAPVDPECSTNVRKQLEVFSSVTFTEPPYCKDGKCTCEYVEKGVLAYRCWAMAIDNGHLEGGCQVLVNRSDIVFSKDAWAATIKAFRRDEMYY